MRTRIHDQVERELKFVPRGDFHQNIFRAAVHARRENDLGGHPEHRGSTALETADRAAAVIRAQSPGFEPELDRDALSS
jgi:hypothetical protein